MITTPNGPFIVLSRLNLAKYTEKKYLSKPLFEYIFYHDHETALALQMANAAYTLDNRDWWWLSRRGLCHYRLALQREAERDMKEAASLHVHPDNHLYLSKIYARIDLPAQAIESYKAVCVYNDHSCNIFKTLCYSDYSDFLLDLLLLKYQNNTKQHILYRCIVEQYAFCNATAITCHTMVQ